MQETPARLPGWLRLTCVQELKVAMRALGFEPKKEEIKKMIADIDKVCSRAQGTDRSLCSSWVTQLGVGCPA